MKTVGILAALLAVVALSGRAAAQDGLSSVMPIVPGASPVVVGKGALALDIARRKTASLFADCLVRKKPRSIARVLALPTLAEQETALNHMILNECLEAGELRGNPLLFRAALYVASYRAYYGSGATAPDAAMAAAATAQLKSVEPYEATLAGLGICLSQRDYADTRRAVMAVPGSADENAAYTALIPLMSTCLSKGETLHLNRTLMQGIFAEALFRQAEVAHAGAPGHRGED